MIMKLIVISLGGSLIVPDGKTDIALLHKFKKTLSRYYKTHKFIIVCGGGSIARRYISALVKEGKSNFELAQAGINATRMNAHFIMQFFGKNANDTLPLTIKEIENNLPRNNIVICGALRFEPDSTSDSTAAKIAAHLHTDFINMTNVDGLFTADPKKVKNAKLIENITWPEFEKKALSVPYRPGQHFVLDQKAAILIRKHKVHTFIIGKDLTNLIKILNNKPFRGTIIKD